MILTHLFLCFPTISFGIFRITDPPGLDVILNCQAKEAFHPHPDLAIYTVHYSRPLYIHDFADQKTNSTGC